MFLLRPALSASVLSSAGEPDTIAAQPETGDSLAHIRAHRQLNKLLIRHMQQHCTSNPGIQTPAS
jgi:hypothetical protein